MSKPKPDNWKVVLISSMVLTGLLFPGPSLLTGPANAVDESPAPSSSPSPTANPTASPIGSPTGSPEPSVVPLPRIYDIDTAASVSVVVNKQRALNPVDYLPRGKVKIGYVWVAKPVAEAYALLSSEVAAKKLGTLCVNSGYRSYASQKIIHAMQVGRLGKTAGEKLAARPGYSEHQTGLAIDVSTTQLGCRIGPFGASRASKWIAANAWQYGFIVRYPSNAKTKITGYVWEPWHLRFVGLELAAEMQTKQITTLEEFFTLPPAAKY